MAVLQSNKEIQLAALEFMRVLDRAATASIEGTFIPVDVSFLYKEQQRRLAYCIALGALCLYILVYTLMTETNYYAQLNPLTIVGLGCWLLLVGVTSILFQQYFKHNRHLKQLLKDPQQSKYGVLITEDYYFERLPDYYHIIPKANIVRVDYEELREDGSIYLELLLDRNDQYEVRGLLYHPEEYDIKAWLGEIAPVPPAKTSDPLL